MKHKKGMTLEELVGHMKIEEAIRLKNKSVENGDSQVKANIVEAAGNKSSRFTKGGTGS